MLSDVGKRPVSLILAFLLILIGIGITFSEVAVDAFHDVAGQVAASGTRTEVIVANVVALVVLTGLQVVLSTLVFKGFNWARVLLLAVTSVTLVTRLAGAIVRVPGSMDIVQMSVDVLIVYALTSLSARTWTHDRRTLRRELRRKRRDAKALGA